jgi:hypothetical protein
VLELERDRATVDGGTKHRRAPDVRAYPRGRSIEVVASREAPFGIISRLSLVHTSA